MSLNVGNQHWQFWPILARFVDYYSLFWVPGVISTINEPLGALTSWLSTLAVFVDSDMFHVLLLTVLGSQSDFHDCRTPKVLLRVSHPHSWFLSILTRFVDCYSPFWGPEEISIVVEPQGALTCMSSTIKVWADFWPISWTIT